MSFPRKHKDLKKMVNQIDEIKVRKEKIPKRPTKKLSTEPVSIEKREKPKFIRKGNYTLSKRSLKYGKNNNTYSVYVETHDALFADVHKYVDDIKEKMKNDNPDLDAYINIAMKYGSINTFTSAGFFSINDETNITTPYEFMDDEDIIEGFWIQISM